MFRSPLNRKLAGRTTKPVRRLALVVSLFVVAAISLPFISAGAQGEKDELQTRASQPTSKEKANVIAGAEFVPGEALVRFRNETSAKNAEAAPMSLRAQENFTARVERFAGSDIVRGLRLAKVDPARTIEAVEELASRSDVLYAEPNYIWRAKRTPNDPRFGEMYGLNRINAPTAWDTTVGSRSVVVGVVDGGVDINHPDLQANIWTNPGEVAGNNVDDDGNGFIDDVHGWDFQNSNSSVFDNEDGDDHATHVAGTIGATGDNNVGVVGVNWEVSLMSLKVLGPNGGSTSRIINGYNYARTMRQRWDTSGGTQGANIRVLNNSYGGPGKSLSALAAIEQLNSAGILFVAAAGNEARDNFSFPDFPSNYDAPNVIAVAATNSSDNLSGFSNFSSRLVSIGAPGSGILSTTPNGTYSSFSGTSMSSPHVAGAAALVCAAVPACANGSAVNSGISVQNLRGLLAYTGDRITALEGKTSTGRRLNVGNAVASALENDTSPPASAGNFRIVSQNGRSVSLAWTAPGDDDGSGTAADYDLFFVNPTTQAITLLPTTLIPLPGGTEQSVAVDVPFRNFSGTIQLRTYDNAGNSSATSVGVTIPVNSGSDPYTVALTGSQPLSTDTVTNFVTGDDFYRSYSLPFAFPYYGVNRTSLTVSTNGTLYFSNPPRRSPVPSEGEADDAGSSIDGLQGQTMIAGLWDDIDINPSVRPGSGVYLVQPDASRVIFRWQGVTFSTPRTNVNFEIELRNDGTIQMRYGENSRIFPVVGISGGEPDAYVVASHTSETQPINLTNAQTVTFSPRTTQVYTISGRVADVSAAGVPNVSVFLSGSQSAVRTTDASGNYSFTDLAGGGNFTVTPSHPNYSFAPASINLTNLTSNQTANFTATLITPTGPNIVQFSAPSYSVNEGEGRVTFIVVRTGDTSGTATVDYRTTDMDTFTVGCADAVNNGGGAYARCDFATTVGRLDFAVGEINKTVTVPIIDDAHVEGAETFQLRLSNAAGAGTTLSTQNVATVTITDNDAVGARNPIITVGPSDYPFFVRQQYLDFLSREPEAGEPWTAVMNRCPNVNTGPAVTTDCDRIAVSGAFFGSPEFQLKGFYVFRFYRLAFNRLPLYTEIVADMSFVAGATDAEVYARRAQLATAFAGRQEFLNAYSSLTNAQYVAALLGRYQLAAVTTPAPATPDSGTRITLSGGDLTNGLDAGTLTRAQVLRAIADSDQVGGAEYNSAFVAVQYYGYLRRTPEAVGYQQNLTALEAGTSPREMINAFLNSAEYRLRFGDPNR